ncbi:MAG TPA: hypothetical protein VGV85_14815 [Longimicrobiaceae bacterium]|nr:hypothetical protein [Longimicrobiaceae bacterium]
MKRSSPRWTCAGLAAAAALVLSACGSAETDASDAGQAAQAVPGGSTAAAVDPCTLLTEADARGVLGDSLQQGRPDAGSTPSCQYVTPSGESLTLQMLPGSVPDFDSYVQQSADAFKAKVEPAAGLGERAAWVGTQLMVLQAPHMLVLTIGQNLGDEERRALGQRLGAAALQRL